MERMFALSSHCIRLAVISHCAKKRVNSFSYLEIMSFSSDISCEIFFLFLLLFPVCFSDLNFFQTMIKVSLFLVFLYHLFYTSFLEK